MKCDSDRSACATWTQVARMLGAAALFFGGACGGGSKSSPVDAGRADRALGADVLGSAEEVATVPVDSSVVEAGTKPVRAREDIAINLSWPVDWNMQHIFADQMKTAPATWDVPEGGRNVALDPQGWPLADAKTYIWLEPRLAGTYRLMFQTRNPNDKPSIGATINVPGTCAVSNLANPEPNRWTADILIDWSGANTLFTLEFGKTSQGVRDVKLMLPIEQGSKSSYPVETYLTNPFKRALEPFSTIRTMQYTATNFSAQVTWSDRIADDAATFNHDPSTFKGLGGSWESVIKIANETQKDVWINVPLMADDEYIRNLATLMRDGNLATGGRGLDAALNLYVEYSNEVWNYAINEARALAVKEVNEQGDPRGLDFDGIADEWMWAFRYPAAQIVRVSKIFREVFGDAQMMARIRPVLAWQAVRHVTSRAALDYIERSPGTRAHPVSYYIYAGSGDSYYEPAMSGITLDQVWDSRTMNVSSWRDTWPDGDDRHSMLYNSFLCNAYGLKLLSYEGGPGLTDAGKNPVLVQAALDPRMTKAIIDHHDAFTSWGGNMLVYYVLNQGGWEWDFVSSTYDLTAAKYKAILDLGAKAPAPLAVGSAPGTVDGNTFHLSSSEWRDLADVKTGSVFVRGEAWVSYSFAIAEAGTYQASFKIETRENEACPLAQAWIDGIPVGTRAIPASSTVDVGPYRARLDAGLHSIRVGCNGPYWRLHSATLMRAP